MPFASSATRIALLPLTLGVLLAGCGGDDVKTMPSVPAPVAGTYTITTALGQPVVFNNGTQASKPFPMYVGYGSAAFHDVKDDANVLFTASDRGPNIDCEDTAKFPIEITGFCGSLAGKIFPDPAFVPSIYQVVLEQNGGKNVARVLKTIPLADKAGKTITGISNDFPDRPTDWTKLTSADKSVTNTEVAYDRNLKALAFDQNGLDVEAMVRLPDGTFWLAEEYAPSIVHVASDGRVLERVVPADSGAKNPITGKSMSVCDALKNGTEKTKPANYTITCALPAITAMRALNRGLENLAVSTDGKTLYFSMQSPLATPTKAAYQASRNARVFTATLKADGSFDKMMGEYVYVLDKPETFPADKSTKQNDVKLSEMSMTQGGTLIQLERIDKVTKLYQVDLSKATNILGSKWDALATQPSLEQQADLAQAGIVPAGKTLAFNTETDLPAAMTPGKVEGLALMDGSNFVLTTDNDFGIVSPETFFFAVNKSLGK